MEDYYDIGGFHFDVTTNSKLAQTWFDRGLAMCIGFNHEEAVRCFEKAIKADSEMAMAYWGIAYALGPNINNVEIESQQMVRAAEALKVAESYSAPCSDMEQGMIAALTERYTLPIPDLADRRPLNLAYANAMRTLHSSYPDASLIAALRAESLMILRPWNHWSKDGQPAEETPEIVEVIEAALTRWPNHPALCHLYIHVMEASPEPEKALPAAERLRDLMPGAGHLVHMPSHIDVLIGNYEQVVKTNQRAIEVDELFLKKEGALNFYTLYRIHNYHFVVYGAMFEGQSVVAANAAREIKKQIPPEMLREQSDFLDAFVPMPMHVMIRFGQWGEILQEPRPESFLPMSIATWHYARAIAFAATGKVDEAEEEQAAFVEAKAKVPKSSILFNNSSLDILGVAEAMIEGEIEYRKGNFDKAFQSLRVCVERDDALNYDEPWGWMQPARHALGALLLEQENYIAAELAYREDLRRHPKNAWALHGLATSLEKQGQLPEAESVRIEFEKASARSDVEIDRSCFCKLKD